MIEINTGQGSIRVYIFRSNAFDESVMHEHIIEMALQLNDCQLTVLFHLFWDRRGGAWDEKGGFQHIRKPHCL